MTTIEHAQAPKNKHEFTKGEKVALVLGSVGIATIGSGIALFESVDHSTNKVIDKLTEPTPVAGQVVHNTQTPPEFVNGLKPSYKESAAYQLIDQYPKYDSEVSIARSIMLDPKDPVLRTLSSEQVQLLSMPLATDLKNASSQELENLGSYHYYDASSQGNDTETTGIQYIDFMIDPNNPHNQKTKDGILAGGRGLVEVNKALSNHPRMQNFTFMYDKVADGWVIEEQDVRTGNQTVSVYEDVVTPGGREEAVLRDTYPLSDSQAQSELHRLFGNK